MKRNAFTIAVLLALGLVLAGGLNRLFHLRFKSGNIYLEYSSFRTDPQGTKILYRALEEYPGTSSERLLKPLDARAPSAETLMLLGCNYRFALYELDEALVPYLKDGGHAVLAFAPEDVRYAKRNSGEADKDEQNGSTNTVKEISCETDDMETADAEHDPDTCSTCQHRTVRERWNITFQHLLKKDLELLPEERLAHAEQAGMKPLPWQSALYFEDPGEEWTVLYRFLDHPVVMERAWGEGRILVMADSYLFSNEAMVKDRRVEQLMALMNNPGHLVFDELHLGVESRESIMMLITRYRLTGAVWAILLLVALFIWKQSSSLIPKHAGYDTEQNRVDLTVSSGEGFVNLLIRQIPQNQLMQTLFDEWKSTFARDPVRSEKIERLEAELKRSEKSGTKPNPVELYNRLHRMLNERK